MSLARPPRAITVARVQAIEIALNWRWPAVLLLGTWLLAQNVLPARFPTWELSTTWVTAAAAVIAGEVALLLHELSHALTARWFGQRVTRIVFHGFLAETVVDGTPQPPAPAALVALMGPSVNIVLAGVAGLAHDALATQGPVDAFLIMLAMGNVAAAVLSLVPLGASDGARALHAMRGVSLEAQIARKGQDQNDKDQQA